MSNENEDDIQKVVVDALNQDFLAVELQLALLSSALISYRKDSCLRPYPAILQHVAEEKDMEHLQQIVDTLPPLEDIKQKKSILSDDCWKLLHWIVKNKFYSVKTCGEDVLKDLQEKTGEASYTVVPDHVFEVGYNTKSSLEFDASALEYGVKLGYHGSRMDNFYSIASNGLQVHLMKNGLFGEGVYCSEDLAVTMPYVSRGGLWKHSSLGSHASCVAVCEILDHPGVKYHLQNDKIRSTAKNSELGEVPNKYFVITSSNLVRIKYLFVFLDKKQPSKIKRRNRNWICYQYPVASILFVYAVFLLLMGLWKSRTVQTFWRQYQRTNNPDFD